MLLPFMFFSQCINEEGFRLFLKTYLEVEDFPVDLCQRLFRSFQNSEPGQEDSTSEIIHTHRAYKQLTAFSADPFCLVADLACVQLSPHPCIVLFVYIW